VSAYRKLEARFARQADIEGAVAVLHWDHQVMMPPGGTEARAEQLATLESLAHEILTAPETGALLDEVAAEDLAPWPAANVREMRRAHTHATAVSADLVAALARASARAEPVWREARAQADFGLLRPALDEVVQLTREEAAAKAEVLGLEPYDALLDGYEPGTTTADVDRLFDPLAETLPGLLERVLAHQGDVPRPELEIAPEVQQALGQRLMAALGFDFDHGRLDVSLHPFCGGVPDDIRMTARWDAADPASGLMAILHETGHALYNANLPKPWRRQPVGEPRSTAVHESQSLLVEMQICRSPAFFRYLAPLLAEANGGPGPSPDALYRNAIRVGRGFIRVDADEVTYPLHVILRYRLEKALVRGALKVADLPTAWNEGMRTLLGVVPPDDRLGCLQDIHWPVGAIGYFPCYTLGAIIAAQLREAAAEALPDLDASLEAGDFRPLTGWAREKIHAQGCFLETPELILAATGRPLSLTPFLTHLDRRYLA